MSSIVRRVFVVFALVGALVLGVVQPASAAPIPTAGTPTVSGTAQVGVVLTASNGTWSSGTTFAYQWKAGGTSISGATAKSFTPSTVQLGKAVTVTVTGTKSGYTPTSKTSKPTAAVAAGVPSAPTSVAAAKNDSARTVTVTWLPPTSEGGAAVTGYRVSRTGTDASGNGPFSYQVAPSARSVEFQNLAPDTTYVFTVAAINRVGDGPGSSADVTTGLGALVLGTPTISGRAQVGATLTANPGAWGPQPVTYTYQWYSGGRKITGAVASTYKPVAADVGKSVLVHVTGSKAGYNPSTRTSAPSTPIAAATATVPSAVASLTVVKNDDAHEATMTWTPPIADGGTPITGYLVARDGIDSNGQGAWSHVYPASQRSVTQLNLAGSTYNLSVTPINAVGNGPTSTMSVTMAVGTLIPVTPVVGDRAVVGNTLSSWAGNWEPYPVTYTYQWYRGGAPIPSANQSGYQIVKADIGYTLTLVVTGSKPGYTPASRTSAPTAVVTADVPGAVASLAATKNDAAHSATLTWTPPATDGGSPITGYLVTRDGVDMNGQGAWSHVYPASQRTVTQTKLAPGSSYKLTVTPMNAAGNGPTTPVRVTMGVGTLTTAIPTIAGTATVGSTLTANPGAWEPQPIVYAYQWYRGGAAITGANLANYQVTSADIGNTLTVGVTGSKTNYNTASKFSAPTAVVR